MVPKGQEPYTPRRPNEEISTITPPTSILARMTASFLFTIWGNKVLVELKDQLKEMYEAGKK